MLIDNRSSLVSLTILSLVQNACTDLCNNNYISNWWKQTRRLAVLGCNSCWHPVGPPESINFQSAHCLFKTTPPWNHVSRQALSNVNIALHNWCYFDPPARRSIKWYRNNAATGDLIPALVGWLEISIITYVSLSISPWSAPINTWSSISTGAESVDHLRSQWILLYWCCPCTKYTLITHESDQTKSEMSQVEMIFLC